MARGLYMWTLQLWHMGLVGPEHGDLPEAGIEPVSSALAGEVLTTGPPGKSWIDLFLIQIFPKQYYILTILN